jgi:hypothetical protein
MKHLLLVTGLAALALMTPTAAVAGPEARIGRTATVDGLRVRPLALVEDSRCPMNARCVWAGRVVVRVAVSGRGRTVTRLLTLGEAMDHAGGKLSLVAAEPNRMAGAPQAPARRYRFTFSYDRRR